MKTKIYSVFAVLSLSLAAWSQGVGINETGANPNPSAILDLESSTKGFLPPRMTQIQMNAIVNPATGLIVYCTNCSPAGLNQFDGTAWSSLTGGATQQTLAANCMANGFIGNYISGTSVVGAAFSVTLTNNTFSAASFAVNANDIVLSGANAGITVSNVSLTAGGTAITTVNIPVGQSQTIFYNLTGSPSASGVLTGTWTKVSLTCSATVNVGSLSDFVASSYCNAASTNGFYASGFAMQTTNTFVIAITNTGSTALNLVAPTAANLGLSYSGTASPAFGVSSVTQSTTGSLAAGATRTFTYVLSGTPSSVGTLTFNWAYGDLTCTKTRNIDSGASNFANTYCNTGALNGTYNSMIALTAANTFTVIINNTSGVTSPTLPAAVAGNLTLSGPGAAGLTVTTATPVASTLVAGGNRTYTYTLSGTPTGTGTLTATWNYMGMTCSKDVTIPALSDAVSANCNAASTNGFYASGFAMQTTNTFVIAITNTGSTALNLVAPTAANLGLSYSGTASPAFAVSSVTQSATGALAAGATRTFTYVLSGTPSSVGTLTFNWAYGDLTCTKTRNIDSGASNFANTYCNTGALNGTYNSMVAMTAANTFIVTINNTSGVTTPSLPAANVSQLVLSGPGAAGLTVSAATPPASTLAVGGNRTYTYTISGTPTGYGTLTATWNYMGMTCSINKVIPFFDCATAVHNGQLTEGQVASGVNSVISYAAGNGSSHSGQIVASTGVTGLTATLNPGSFANGPGTLTYTITGTPASVGTASFAINIGGQSCTLIRIVPLGYVPNICNPSNPTAIIDVTNPLTGRTWMDRNLGANRVAIFSGDTQSYGSLYQWGRGSDGHQCVNRYAGDGVTTSSNTALNATVSSDTPPHGNFIRTNTGNNDWRSPQNNNLWQGVNGTNNPCPSGYRLPTQTELNEERLTWPPSPNNGINGAFNSPLKLTPAYQRLTDGSYFGGSQGYYWSSSVVGTNAVRLVFFSADVSQLASASRATGSSVRCIKD